MSAGRKGAVTAAQTVLLAGGKAVRVDGIWGPRTTYAYETASVPLQAKVEDAVTARGFTVKELSGIDWISEAALEPIVLQVSAKTGRTPRMIWDFIKLESAQRRINGVVYYNQRSVSPSGLFHGLGQMGRPAWSDVKKAYRDTPEFLVGRYDPLANLLAAMRYSVLNEQEIVRQGYKGPITVEVLYAAHNQGATGFMRLLKNKRETSNFKNQSAKAQQVINVALRSNGVVLA